MRDRLYRSRDDRVLFGVCGGIADWMDLDPSLVRIVFALLVITGGIGLLLYIIMAIVVPEEPDYLPTPVVPGAGAPTGTMADGSAAPTGTSDAVATGATPEPAAGAPMTGGYQPSSWMTERDARRAARRAARQQRGTERDGRAGLIFGSILVILGVWFLVQRYIPALNADFVGPIVLIAIGAIVLAGALSRSSEDGPAKPR